MKERLFSGTPGRPTADGEPRDHRLVMQCTRTEHAVVSEFARDRRWTTSTVLREGLRALMENDR